MENDSVAEPQALKPVERESTFDKAACVFWFGSVIRTVHGSHAAMDYFAKHAGFKDYAELCRDHENYVADSKIMGVRARQSF